MKLRHATLVCGIAWTISLIAHADSVLWKFEPGVTVRGTKPESWTLDLRSQTLESAARAARKLSTRLYGSTEAGLHAPLTFLTDFPAARIFAFNLSAVSSGGSDLVVKTNGAVAGRQVWPGATSTPGGLMFQ